MAKKTFHDSYLTGAACLLVILRLPQVTVDWVVELHYGNCFGAGFWPSSPHNFATANERSDSLPWKTIQASLEFWILGTGLRILCQWNLDSRFQSLVRFRIPRAVLRISKPRIPHSIRMTDFPDFGFHGQKFPKFRNPASLTRGARSDCVPKQTRSAIRHNIDAVSREPHNGQVGLNKVVH